MTFEKLKKISDFIETKGIHDNKEKSEYLLDNFHCTVLRNNQGDKDFKDFVLSLSKNKQVTYADEITETTDSNGNITLSNKKQTSIDITHIQKISAIKESLNKNNPNENLPQKTTKQNFPNITNKNLSR
jgi:hypothetical protein